MSQPVTFSPSSKAPAPSGENDLSSSGHGHAHGAAGHAHGPSSASHGHAHGSGDTAHGHAHGYSQTANSALRLALLLTGSFMVVEATVGWLTGSLALLADAGHMLSDAAALVLALIAQRFAARPRTTRSTFGFRRAEVLAAFVNGMTLTAISVLIIKEAVSRWFDPVRIDAPAMLLTASLGLGVNLFVAWILMRGQKDSVNVRAAFAHVLSDALGSVAAIGAGIAALLWNFHRADPLLSGFIAILVAWSGYRIMKETAAILLEGAPPHLEVGAIERTIRETSGVVDVHDLHVWRISEHFDVLTAHVVIERGHHGTDVCKDVAAVLKDRYQLEHVTIQPEPQPPDEVVTVRRSRDGAPIQSI